MGTSFENYPKSKGLDREQELLKELKGRDALTLEDTESLRTLAHDIQVSAFDPALTLTLCKAYDVSALLEQIKQLAQESNPEHRAQLHHFLDFCVLFARSEHNLTPDLPQSYELEVFAQHGQPTLDNELQMLLHSWPKEETNYLLAMHIEDALESFNLWGTKEGAHSGSPGGASDETIFSSRLLYQSFFLRRELNLYTGHSIAHMLVPLAEGYIGLYIHGQLVQAYPAPNHERYHAQRNEDEMLIAKNDSEYDWIYDSLAIPLPENAHPSLGLRKLQDLWNLYDDCKQDGQPFYFDFSRIPLEALHPTVRADILEHNFKILQEIHAHDSLPLPLSEKTFMEAVFPDGSGTSARCELYRYLSSFSMREKLVREFGDDIASLTLYEQSNFLSFLEEADIESVREVETLVLQHGMDFTRTFLLIGDDVSLQQAFFSFAHEHPERVASVIEDIGALAATIARLKGQLLEIFGSAHSSVAEECTRRLVIRAKETLQACMSGYAENDGVSAVLGDAAIFAFSFRLLRERGELSLATIPESASLSFKSVPSLNLTPEERMDMAALYQKAHSDEDPSYIARLIDANNEVAKSSASTFYLMKHADALIGMIRFDEKRNERGDLIELYAGGFNVDRAYGNGKLGEALFEASFEQMKKRGIPIKAHVRKDSPMVDKYRLWGFVIIGETTSSDESKIPLYELLMAPSQVSSESVSSA